VLHRCPHIGGKGLDITTTMKMGGYKRKNKTSQPKGIIKHYKKMNFNKRENASSGTSRG